MNNTFKLILNAFVLITILGFNTTARADDHLYTKDFGGDAVCQAREMLMRADLELWFQQMLKNKRAPNLIYDVLHLRAGIQDFSCIDKIHHRRFKSLVLFEICNRVCSVANGSCNQLELNLLRSIAYLELQIAGAEWEANIKSNQ